MKEIFLISVAIGFWICLKATVNYVREKEASWSKTLEPFFLMPMIVLFYSVMLIWHGLMLFLSHLFQLIEVGVELIRSIFKQSDSPS